MDRLGGYLLFERGNIQFKGKFEPIKSYWLVGESDHRKNRRKFIINSERSRNSLSELLFPPKSKSSQTPEMKSRQTSNDIFRSISPRIRCTSIDDKSDRSLKPLLPIIEKNHSSIETLHSNAVEVTNQVSNLYSSKSQYSLNLISGSKDISLKPISQSINGNEVTKESDLSGPLHYKSIEISSNSIRKTLNSENKITSNVFQKQDNCRNGFSTRRAISLPPSLTRKMSRTESLPQISIFENKLKVKQNEQII